jgi:hypothetical protein
MFIVFTYYKNGKRFKSKFEELNWAKFSANLSMIMSSFNPLVQCFIVQRKDWQVVWRAL